MKTHPLRSVQPFSNDACTLDELSIENSPEEIALYGNINIACNKQGLEQLRELNAFLVRVQEVLEAKEREGNLSEEVAEVGAVDNVKNPFA